MRVPWYRAAVNELHLHRIPLRHVLHTVAVTVMLGIILYICTSKIADFDFWWHIAAGKKMLESGWIGTDPFAFTRTGQPYLANHEWLAQIIFAIVWKLSGATGIVFLRTVIASGILLALLSIDARHVWINTPLAVLAGVLMLPGFVDRPQLFSFFLFACQLILMLRYLESAENNPHRRHYFLLWLLGFQLLWVNLHGSAALLGVVIFACMLVQRIIDMVMRGWNVIHRRELVMLLITGLGLVVLLFVSPSGLGNLQYIQSLFTDDTVQFIREWEPRAWTPYLRDLSLLWILGLATIAWSRRRWVFCLLILILTGILSRQAFRHEMLFVCAVTGIIFFQLRWNEMWQRWTERLSQRAIPAFALLVVFLGLTGWFAFHRSQSLQRSQNLFGYGTFEPASDSADFLEREKITGNIFNSYEYGGYLEYRGFPVFVDGRNVDFGYDFLRRMFDAAQQEKVWMDLEKQYDLSVAVLYYDLVADLAPMPYVALLEKRPDWVLVYLDDWTAVYLKDTPAQHAIIEKNRYAALTPGGMENGSVADEAASGEGEVIEAELIRVIQQSSSSLKPRIALARLYLRAGLTTDALGILQDAVQRWPHRYEPWEALGTLYGMQGKWAEAGEMYEKVIAVAGKNVEGIDYDALADVFEKAGDDTKAEMYRKKAGVK